MSDSLFIGAARSEYSCPKTVSVFLAGLKRVWELSGRRLLDVGCGDGTFTTVVGATFQEVHGVDVQTVNIEGFRKRVGHDPKYTLHLRSASSLEFAGEYFDAIMSIETLEHVDNLEAVAGECARVLRPGGQIVITVPKRWFPIEGHGGVLFGKTFSRLPLITYIPWLHNRLACARVFTVMRLDRLFVPLGFSREALSYLWPTFEHGGGGMQRTTQRFFRGLFPLMRWLETSPVRMFGTSIVVRYQKNRLPH